MDPGDLEGFLRDRLADPDAGFAIGALGALAEFQRDRDEPLSPARFEDFCLASPRGGIRLRPHPRAVGVVFEPAPHDNERRSRAVACCLPWDRATCAMRATITELGPDVDAIRPGERDAILFDLGLGARNVDFCVRSDDADLVRALRAATGRSLFEARGQAFAALLDANPHRIALSALGRIEVYQAIPRGRTPCGPHTHLLPKLLASQRTHDASVPVPQGYLPALFVYPGRGLPD